MHIIPFFIELQHFGFIPRQFVVNLRIETHTFLVHNGREKVIQNMHYFSFPIINDTYLKRNISVLII